MSKQFAARLIALRKATGLTQEEIAERAAINRVTYANYESGRFEPRAKSMRALAEALGCPMQALMEVAGMTAAPATSNATRIPVYGSIPAGIPLEEIEDIQGWEEIPARWTDGGQQYFALRVHGQSMTPDYLNGDIIILRKQETCESGQDCAVRVESDEVTFKRVRRTPTGIVLQPLNPAFEPLSFSNAEIVSLPVTILGVVVEQRRRRA